MTARLPSFGIVLYLIIAALSFAPVQAQVLTDVLTLQQIAATAPPKIIYLRAVEYSMPKSTSATSSIPPVEQLISDEIGTAFIVSSNGIAVTAYHVVSGWLKQTDDMKVRHPIVANWQGKFGAALTVQIVDWDEGKDVAILKILNPQQFEYFQLCYLDRPEAGEVIFSPGFANGDDIRVLSGTYDNASGESNTWQVQLQSIGGTSGGPVLDRFGVVIAIVDKGVNMTPLSTVTPIQRAKGLIEDNGSPSIACGARGTPKVVKSYVVCHGELKERCDAHPFDVMEICSDANGVGGADPMHVSGPGLCEPLPFVVQSVPGTVSEGGNHCGYSWYKISCMSH